jgi:NAD(P)-dependent dehydrogenase (short-subunit alcohol dehydrogenase family)
MENLVNTAVSEYGRLDVMVNNAGIFSGLHTIVDENRKTNTTAPCSSTSRAYGWAASSRSGRCCPRTRSTGHGDASSTSPRSEAWSAPGRARLLRRQGRRGELTRQLAVDFAAERINVNALYRSLDCVQSLFPS